MPGTETSRRAVTGEEAALWRVVMRDAQPLRPQPAPPPPPPPKVEPPPVAQTAPSPPTQRASRPPPPPPAPAPAPVLTMHTEPGHTAGIDRRTDQRLRRGQLDIDGRIDLHGLSQAQAHDALAGFVRRGWYDGRRCLLVITGKGSGGEGQGVLRAAVPRWLHETPFRPLVLAIHPARTDHGGDGAYYILLRRRR
ncbi:DNA mismatch repair protein MutS [uncultured Gammaproteobacteria bacterium]